MFSTTTSLCCSFFLNLKKLSFIQESQFLNRLLSNFTEHIAMTWYVNIPDSTQYIARTCLRILFVRIQLSQLRPRGVFGTMRSVSTRSQDHLPIFMYLIYISNRPDFPVFFSDRFQNESCLESNKIQVALQLLTTVEVSALGLFGTLTRVAFVSFVLQSALFNDRLRWLARTPPDLLSSAPLASYILLRQLYIFYVAEERLGLFLFGFFIK